MTPVTPTGVRAVGTDLSDRGHVTGFESGSRLYEAHPLRWSRRTGLERLPTAPDLGMALGVNDRGQAFGLVYPQPTSDLDVAPGEIVAWDRGELVEPPPGTVLRWTSGTAADRINDRGQIAVNLVLGDQTRAAIWQIGGAVTDLGTLGGARSEATAINEAGEVVGSSLTADGERHAFLWRDGEMIDLGTLGGPISDAVDINDRGEVLGTSMTADSDRPFVWRDGEMTALDSLGGTCCWPHSDPEDINNRGQVVGSSYAPDGTQHAVLWQDGVLVDLGALVDGEVSAAGAINDRGQILGSVDFARTVLWTVTTRR